MAHDVFISYSIKDKRSADAVCATLESKGIRCWIAPRDILPGMDWGEAIITAIKPSRVLVLVFSSNSNNSDQVKREVERAVSKKIPIVPFRIEDVTPSGALEYYLGTSHWLDALTPPLENHLQKLAESIKSLLSLLPESLPEELAGKPVIDTGKAKKGEDLQNHSNLADVPAANILINQSQPLQAKEQIEQEAIQKLLVHLKNPERQKFSSQGRYRYVNQYIWTDGAFFEIAESIPTDLQELFPLKENSNVTKFVERYQNLLSEYSVAYKIVPPVRQGFIDLISEKNIRCRVNNIYYEYLQVRYPEAMIMIGKAYDEPVLFIVNNRIKAGVIGVKM